MNAAATTGSKAATRCARSKEAIAGLFGGLELVEPGVTSVARWRGLGGDKGSWWLGGVARKP